MKAWRLTMAGGAFRLEDVPDPVPRPGAVIVRVHAAPLVSYLRAYVSGTLPGYHPPEETFTPGTNAVGVIEQHVKSDAELFQEGQGVFLIVL